VDCEQVLPLISARLDGELPPGEATGLDAHLAACPGCRAAAAAFRLQDADLRRAFAPRRQAAARLAERVVARLHEADPAAPPARPARRLPWLPMLLSAAAGFLIAVAVFRPWQRPPQPVPPDDPGRVSVTPSRPTLLLALATGAVEVQPPGQDAWQSVTGGGTVEVGCRVRTPPEVCCEFRCPDDRTEVRLNGNTEVAFETRHRLTLERGQILANVLKDAVPFEVEVARATVTALGTRFDLWSRPQDTRLAVLEGRTQVRGPGAETVVQGGELATIVNGRVTETRQGEDLLRATDWVQELLQLKGGKDPELAHRIDKKVNNILAQIGNEKASGLFSDEEIRKLGYHCVVPLTRFIESDLSRGERQRDKRRRAARLVADLAQPWHVPDLINLLADADPQVRSHAARGLVRLVPEMEPMTPEAWGTEPSAPREHALKKWHGWWDTNKDRYPRLP
jgi:ferric-dicitrate binding protein FerR (iron transport regulator)